MTKPLVIPIGNHWQHGAHGICLNTGTMFSTAHRQKNVVAGHKYRFVHQDNLISSALARAWAQVEQREPVRAASGVPGVSLWRSVQLQPSPCILHGLAVKLQMSRTRKPLLGSSWQRRSPVDCLWGFGQICVGQSIYCNKLLVFFKIEMKC